MFIRTKENFVCENCGAKVMGNGYTNHCPKCLWSKHVDISPGDREEVCKGLMKPIGVETKGGVPIKIKLQCVACGFNRTAPIVEDDSTEEIQALF